MRPLDPRLLRHASATTGFIITVVALGVAGTSATIAIAYGLSQFVVGIFVAGKTFGEVVPDLQFSLVAAVLRALVVWFQEYAGVLASSKVKLQLRTKALESIERQGSALVAKLGSGSLSQLLGTGLDALDVYFSKYLPQLIYTAIVTPGFVILIWFLDLESGVALVATIPLIPLFMVMIGLFTQTTQREQQDSLSRLNGHFLEILRGTTTLKIFNRIPKQLETLRAVSEDFRVRTMRVLRISFLSGFALELASSLSVALIAVSIGLRLVGGNLDLATGLFVLLLAPEAYLPLRMVGAQFHAASEGVEVANRVIDLIELEEQSGENPNLVPKPGKLIVITGKSGAGKSTLMETYAREFPNETSWMSQNPVLLAGSIAVNVAGRGSINEGLLQEANTMALCSDIRFDLELGEFGEGLSGGQRQRIGLARTIYNLLSTGKRTLLLDEPTSAVDLEVQEQIVSNIKSLVSQGYAAVVISHQDSWIYGADERIEIGHD